MSWDFSDAERAEKQLIDDLENLAQRAPLFTAREAQDRIIASNAFKGDRLRHSFTASKSGIYQAVIQTKKTYASFLEEGTSPHVIRAKRKRYLRFETASGNVFRKQVHHPGNKATHFFSQAVQQAGDFLDRHLKEASEEITRRFNQS